MLHGVSRCSRFGVRASRRRNRTRRRRPAVRDVTVVYAPGADGPDDAMDSSDSKPGWAERRSPARLSARRFPTQTTQTLADGNQIQRSTTGTFARDSQGRTRRDMTLPAIGPWGTSGQAAPHVVFINDNVAGTQYVLQPDKKVARQDAAIARRQARRTAHRRRGVRIGSGAGGANRRNVTTTSLGTQTINGVQAEGTRITRTIPAGAIGNANAIVITNERWYSPDCRPS